MQQVSKEADVLRTAAPDDEGALPRSQRQGGLLDQRDERLQELRAVRAVDRPMVAGQGQRMIGAMSSSPSTTTGSSLTAPTARMVVLRAG